MAETISQMEKRAKVLRNRSNALLAQIKNQERKETNRAKYIVGGILIKLIEENYWEYDKIMGLLEEHSKESDFEILTKTIKKPTSETQS